MISIDLMLQKLQKHHKESYSHSLAVSWLSESFGAFLDLSQKDRDILRIGGLLHDVGKYYIPASILSKKGKLTNEEFKMIEKHPVLGLMIAKKIDLGEFEQYRAIIENIILCHHANLQGRSYPELNKIKKGLHADVISICDCYAALRIKRDYKQAFSVEKSLNILNNNGYNAYYLGQFNNFIQNKERIAL